MQDHLRRASDCDIIFDYAYYRMYTLSVVFTWDEPKRQANLAKHGLDFADAEKMFAGPMVLFEDNRADVVNSA